MTKLIVHKIYRKEQNRLHLDRRPETEPSVLRPMRKQVAARDVDEDQKQKMNNG